MNAQLKKGALDLCILAIIKNKKTYGYDIYQSINKTLNISESTIYPILRKFVKEGYCETYLQESSDGPPRKYFKITNRGEDWYMTLHKEWNDFIKTVSVIVESSKKRMGRVNYE